MITICTKYGFDILIISGSYGGHRRHTTYDGRRTPDAGRRTTPRVWHKLPTGELKINIVVVSFFKTVLDTPIFLISLDIFFIK